jgi:hypothetical protein
MKNIGAKLMSEQLATQFNYTGMKGKQTFRRFKNICGCIAGKLGIYTLVPFSQFQKF